MIIVDYKIISFTKDDEPIVMLFANNASLVLQRYTTELEMKVIKLESVAKQQNYYYY